MGRSQFWSRLRPKFKSSMVSSFGLNGEHRSAIRSHKVVSGGRLFGHALFLTSLCSYWALFFIYLITYLSLSWFLPSSLISGNLCLVAHQGGNALEAYIFQRLLQQYEQITFITTSRLPSFMTMIGPPYKNLLMLTLLSSVVKPCSLWYLRGHEWSHWENCSQPETHF